MSFLTTVATLKPGESLTYRAPSGERITVTRRRDSADGTAFAALSSTCPHLGCQVHWEPQNQRFFCPCHNGAFDADGTATQGPPADAGQSLVAYPLKVEGGLLYLEVPVETLSPPVPRLTGTPRPGSRA